MKNEKTLGNSPFGNSCRTVARSDTDTVRELVNAALKAAGEASQKCLAAGQALNEMRERLAQPRVNGRFEETGGNGFEDWIRQNIPDVGLTTARTWMRAAANVVKALPPAPAAGDIIDVEAISVSSILSTPSDELPEEARAWRQTWLDFTSHKTIKECLAGVFIDGDADHRVDRAINGKMKGGAGGDRKDFPLFVARKLRDAGVHMGHWEGMSAAQHNEVCAVVLAAISGDEVLLRGRNAGKPMAFEAWPLEVCAVVADACRERLKGAK